MVAAEVDLEEAEVVEVMVVVEAVVLVEVVEAVSVVVVEVDLVTGEDEVVAEVAEVMSTILTWLLNFCLVSSAAPKAWDRRY